MKKIVINKPYDVEIKDVPIPIPGEQELLIRTELSGISAGTEMMLYRGTFPNFDLKKWPQWTDYPVHPGYELVGTVISVGKSLQGNKGGNFLIASLAPKSEIVMTQANEFKVGDRVVCLGEHAEYVTVPATLAAKIPDNISSEEATLAVLATTAMHCIRRSEIRYGDTVIIIGCGVLGYLTMQHAKNSGARKVMVLDIDDERLAIAKAAGADVCINPKKTDLINEIKNANGGILADIVIEASGFAGTEQTALDIVRDRGCVVLLGWHTKGINFLFGDLVFKELTIYASNAIGPGAGLPYAYVRWCSDQSLKWAIDLIAQGKLTGKHFSPTKFSYKDVAKVYEMIDKHDPTAGLQTVLYW